MKNTFSVFSFWIISKVYMDLWIYWARYQILAEILRYCAVASADEVIDYFLIDI